MTPEDAIKIINNECENTFLLLRTTNEFADALAESIKALEEVKQYREIGTVEECREAVEKQKPKKPLLKSEKRYH